MSQRVVAVSGGFDPPHVGHVRMFEEAKILGDHLIVILNNDNWLIDKKGAVFMPEREREEIIRAFRVVDDVYLTEHVPHDPDRSVSKALLHLHPNVFANGGDRHVTNTPEAMVCEELGIEMVYGVGRGGKSQSSSELIAKALKTFRTSVRPWGKFISHDKGPGWNLKTIYVSSSARLSLQYHHHREEYWVLVEGDAYAVIGPDRDSTIRTELVPFKPMIIPHGCVHRLGSQNGGVVIEISKGDFDENDIIRLEDDYSR